ncbi:hypothetical protein WJX84_007109 [Apatococcus fuscideae]|uniref:CS domain-containing protein n=1 Tax=Apatococcus fuscideae TaxID=2026836 RepID=A0AAW1T3S7_9CHLO
MESYSLTVLGSGLSCLHLLARLPPRLLEETLLIPSDSDQLSGWSAHLRRAGARLLRLPINQSPHKDPGALSAWANHEDQLQDMDVSHNDSLPLPSIQLLETFCHQQIMNKLPARITRSDMLCAASLDEDDEGTGYVLTLSDQREIKTKAVVYTETPAVPVVPTWARSLWHSGGQQQEGCPCIQHSSQLDVRDGRTSGQRVAVVGGGMTAASLALAATAAGAAHVHLISRRQLQEQEQEVDPGWSKASDHQDEQDGSGDELPVDCIWLATGSSPDAMACPFLTSVQQQWPTRLLGGYPCLQDASLAWPGIPLLFIGRMTLLSQGPAAALMPGMRKAADIVMASLLQHLTGSRGPGRLNGGTTADDHDPSVSRPDDADITLDGCGLMPEQLISKVHVRTNPHIIDVSDLPASMERLEIQKYNFADDEFEVMVLFDLPEPVSKDQVRVRFETSSVEMWATGRQAYRLYIPRLYGTIVPSKCNLRIRHCKIALQLRKTSDAEWRFLRG